VGLRTWRVLVALICVAFGLIVSSSGRGATLIQPGAPIIAGSSLCTLNWIYDGTAGQSGNVFAGTARHCVTGVGQLVALDESGATPGPFGSVAFMSPNLDYALIRVDPSRIGEVSAAMRGHPNIPQGVSTTATAQIGDTMQFSGYGVGVSLTNITREQRTGILGYNDGQQQYVYGVITPGDSGGPVGDVTDGNKAFGIVDTVGVALTPVPQAGEGGVSLEGLLADAASSGFTVALRTV
jgi:hypothetical protein